MIIRALLVSVSLHLVGAFPRQHSIRDEFEHIEFGNIEMKATLHAIVIGSTANGATVNDQHTIIESKTASLSRTFSSMATWNASIDTNAPTPTLHDLLFGEYMAHYITKHTPKSSTLIVNQLGIHFFKEDADGKVQCQKSAPHDGSSYQYDVIPGGFYFRKGRVVRWYNPAESYSPLSKKVHVVDNFAMNSADADNAVLLDVFTGDLVAEAGIAKYIVGQDSIISAYLVDYKEFQNEKSLTDRQRKYFTVPNALAALCAVA